MVQEAEASMMPMCIITIIIIITVISTITSDIRSGVSSIGHSSC